ncbi:MAG: c-type cytochrome [Bacteroidia bacterium]
MKSSVSISVLAISLAWSLWFGACAPAPAPDTSEAAVATVSDSAALIERGRYLVSFGGCNDCHSPKRMGPQGPEIVPGLLLSGYPAEMPVPPFDSKMLKDGFAMLTPDLTAAAGPWGISFAANLTPDETGLGNWTFAQFKKALTQGKYKGMDGGCDLLPPMPWINYVELTDEDLGAMFAYLQHIPAVNNLVPAPIPPQ